jgi:hypothetical protein
MSPPELGFDIWSLVCEKVCISLVNCVYYLNYLSDILNRYQARPRKRMQSLALVVWLWDPIPLPLLRIGLLVHGDAMDCCSPTSAHESKAGV